MDFLLSKARLRPWRSGDEASVALHANNPKIWRNMRDTFPHPYTLEDAFSWVEHAKDSDTTFAIEVDGEASGGIGLRIQTDVARRSAEIGYWLGEAH